VPFELTVPAHVPAPLPRSILAKVYKRHTTCAASDKNLASADQVLAESTDT
jgi:hypothetical protein